MCLITEMLDFLYKNIEWILSGVVSSIIAVVLQLLISTLKYKKKKTKIIIERNGIKHEIFISGKESASEIKQKIEEEKLDNSSTESTRY